MPRVPDSAILYELNRGLPDATIAYELNVPLTRVARLRTGGRSAHDPERGRLAAIGFKALKGDTTADKPSPATAAYWAGLQEPTPPPRPKHTAHMVPDDRADEGLTFEGFMGRVVAAVRGGRGAA